VEKLDSHFDIVQLIKTIRRTEVLANIMLSKHHEYFLPILKQSLLIGKNDPENTNSDCLEDGSLSGNFIKDESKAS
jgi:hypothetical protein